MILWIITKSYVLKVIQPFTVIRLQERKKINRSRGNIKKDITTKYLNQKRKCSSHSLNFKTKETNLTPFQTPLSISFANYCSSFFFITKCVNSQKILIFVNQSCSRIYIASRHKQFCPTDSLYTATLTYGNNQ